MAETEYQPGVYVKGDSVRNAGSPAEAVSLVWNGYVRSEEPSEGEQEKAEPAPSRPEPDYLSDIDPDQI